MEETELSIKVNDTSKIPNNNIYKLHVLNEEGNVEQIYVFCAGLSSEKDSSSLFSDIELSYYKEKNVSIIFSDELISQAIND